MYVYIYIYIYIEREREQSFVMTRNPFAMTAASYRERLPDHRHPSSRAFE